MVARKYGRLFFLVPIMSSRLLRRLPRTLHELKAIISWFCRKYRVEREKIIVAQKRLDQKEQKAVHMGVCMWG